MTQREAVSRIAKEIHCHFNITTNDMATLLPFFNALYAIGFDDGRGQNKHRKKIQQIHNGVVIGEYESINIAARAVMGDGSNISKAAIGKKKTAAGYQWRYVEPNNLNQNEGESSKESKEAISFSCGEAEGERQISSYETTL